jgi:hypothetical protein
MHIAVDRVGPHHVNRVATTTLRVTRPRRRLAITRQSPIEPRNLNARCRSRSLTTAETRPSASARCRDGQAARGRHEAGATVHELGERSGSRASRPPRSCTGITPKPQPPGARATQPHRSETRAAPSGLRNTSRTAERGVQPTKRTARRGVPGGSAPWTSIAGNGEAGQRPASRHRRLVEPTCHHANPPLLVEGSLIGLSARSK